MSPSTSTTEQQIIRYIPCLSSTDKGSPGPTKISLLDTQGDTTNDRPSVKKQLEDIKQKQKTDRSTSFEKNKAPVNKNKSKRRNEHGRT